MLELPSWPRQQHPQNTYLTQGEREYTWFWGVWEERVTTEVKQTDQQVSFMIFAGSYKTFLKSKPAQGQTLGTASPGVEGKGGEHKSKTFRDLMSWAPAASSYITPLLFCCAALYPVNYAKSSGVAESQTKFQSKMLSLVGTTLQKKRRENRVMVDGPLPQTPPASPYVPWGTLWLRDTTSSFCHVLFCIPFASQFTQWGDDSKRKATWWKDKVQRGW